MRVAIVGSRNYPNLEQVREYVNSLPDDSIIVSGGARGVDRVAEDAAIARGLKTLIFPARWDRYGSSAGFFRNKFIIQNCDRLVAFWDEKSKGTQHSIGLAKEANKPTEVIIDSKTGPM